MIVQQAVRLALRQRQHRGLWIAAVVIFLLGTMLWSHFHNKADPSQWDGQTATCERVIDGDTVVINAPGMEHEHMRLRGVDAPEITHPGLAQDAYFGREAKQYLANRIEGKSIVLKFDGTEKRDRYQRLLGYVYLGDSDCVNVDLVRDGYAYVDRRFKTMLQSALDQSETQARARGAGLWKGVKENDMPAWRQKWLAKKGVTPDD